jgi:hypothetical protein
MSTESEVTQYVKGEVKRMRSPNATGAAQLMGQQIAGNQFATKSDQEESATHPDRAEQCLVTCLFECALRCCCTTPHSTG